MPNRRIPTLWGIALCLYVLVLAAGPAGALVYSGGTGHTTAPTGTDGQPADPGFANVGPMSIGSGVYLGDGWVISPYHVYQFQHQDGREGRARIELGGATYYEVLGSQQRIQHGSGEADLVCFRIDRDPGLPALTIRSGTPPRNTAATIIAAGRTAVPESTTWYVDTTPATWVWNTELFEGYDIAFTGFQTTGTVAKRWGTNKIASVSDTTVNGPFGTTWAFWTVFDSGGGANEAQGVDRDSGGGLFTYDSQSGQGQLAGLVLTLGLLNNQPDSNPPTTAIYTNSTYFADLTAYRAQIDAIRDQRVLGDADGDGFVDDNDLSLLLANWGRQPVDYTRGDFNEDGEVNDNDLSLLLAAWPTATAPPEPVGGSAVPEPAAALLLAAGAIALLRPRRHRRRPCPTT